MCDLWYSECGIHVGNGLVVEDFEHVHVQERVLGNQAFSGCVYHAPTVCRLL